MDPFSQQSNTKKQALQPSAVSAAPMPTPQTADTPPRSPLPETNSLPPTVISSDDEARAKAKLSGHGTVIDGYVVIDKIGKGGMGVVYKACQPDSGQVVALKLIGEGNFSDEESAERFKQEYQALARMQPVKNVVQIFHVGHHNQKEPYYVMPYLSGGSLATQLNRYLKDRRRSVALVEKIARAVHHLHRQNVLHRDIKPGNILLDADDEPFLSDFGLVKLLDADHALTRATQRVGTPPYMAPEQTGMLPTPVSAQTDIWALGILLYEILTGTRPFGSKADSDTATLYWRICKEAPPRLRTLLPDIDAGLEAVILKCLEKNPADRFGDAGALADELGRWLRDEPLRTRPVSKVGRAMRWPRRHPKKTLLGSTLVAFLGFGLILANFLNDPERPLRTLQAEMAAGKPITLVGATGKPAYAKLLTPGVGVIGVTKDYYTIESGDLCLVELMRDVPFLAYRFKVKLRDNGSDPAGLVGLFVSYSGSSDDAGDVHFFYRWAYNDTKVEENGNKIHLQPVLIHRKPNSPSVIKQLKRFGSLPFALEGIKAERWRELAIDVYPQKLVARFDADSTPAQSFETIHFDTDMRVRNHLKEWPDMGWTTGRFVWQFQSTAAIGIMVHGGQVSVSNATVSSLEIKN